MTKIPVQVAMRQTYNRLTSAGFVQKPAHAITLEDRLYSGVLADITRAVPVVDIRLWRNGRVHIVRQCHAGNVGLTHDADELLWVVPQEEME